jgi:hypothetical protein
MKCRSHHRRRGTPERCARPAAVPERLVRAAVTAAIRVAAQAGLETSTATPGTRPPEPGDDILDELGRRSRQFPSVGVPPAFDEPCDKGSHHVIWYAC